MLPKIIKNFNTYIDGFSYAGLAEEIVLPSLERTTESYRGAGMLGPVDLDLGIEELKLELTLAEFNEQVLKGWGVADSSGIGVRFLGSAKADNSDSANDAIEISVRGRWKKIDPGTVKAGEMAKMKVEMPLTYYKYTFNNNVLVEIDLINGKEVVNGTDLTSAVMRSLGLTG